MLRLERHNVCWFHGGERIAVAERRKYRFDRHKAAQAGILPAHGPAHIRLGVLRAMIRVVLHAPVGR